MKLVCHLFWGKVEHAKLVNGLIAYAVAVFGAGAARQGTFQDAHAMAGRITESGRSHEGKGWYLEKVCGMKKAGVGTDHCMGAEYKIAGF